MVKVFKEFSPHTVLLWCHCYSWPWEPIAKLAPVLVTQCLLSQNGVCRLDKAFRLFFFVYVCACVCARVKEPEIQRGAFVFLIICKSYTIHKH